MKIKHTLKTNRPVRRFAPNVTGPVTGPLYCISEDKLKAVFE